MSGQIPTPIRSIALVALFLAWSVGVGVPTNIARADDCLAAPNSRTPAGSHWYYYTDPVKQRKCWFLRAKDQSTQQQATQDQSEAAAATDTTAEEPATASVGTPTSISPADTTPPVSPIKQQPAPKSRATTKYPAEAPSPQTSTQPPTPAPAVGVAAPTNIASADDCVSAPNSPAPEGKHWFYRTDRATQRKCWYLRAKDQPTQRMDAQAPSAAAPATRASAFEYATASAGVPMSKSPADSAPSLPSLKPQPAQEVAKQSAPPLSPAEPAPQASAQAAGPAPVAATVPPYPSAGATASARQPNTAPSDARSDLLRPTVEARAPNDTERATGGAASTANPAGMATSVTGTLIQMSLIVLLGLSVAGLLYRVVTAVARRRQIIIDHPNDRVGHHNPHDNLQQHGSVDQGDQFIKDLHRSPLSVANDRDDQQQHEPVERDQLDDSRRSPILGENYASGTNNYGAHHPYGADDEWLNNTRHTNRAPQFTKEANEHDDTLAQLRRDLDRLLQPKSPDDRQQHGSIDEQELPRSISDANDYEAGRPHPANDELPINARRTGGASLITEEVSEREDRLAQLRRDLDWLLQTPKSA